MKRALLAAVGVVMLGAAMPSTARAADNSSTAGSTAPVTSWGYIGMDDGVQLRYSLIRPASSGRFPVALNYGPYLSGTDLTTETFQTQRLVAAGYAVLGVNIRGTGCSGGHFDLFERREAIDGVDVVEWAAAQHWSTGHVGMFGLSAPGISQYGPAGLRAPHLDAIAPFQTSTDIYRDAARPGGIYEASFPVLWALGLQPALSDRASATALSQGDSDCARPTAERQTGNLAANGFLPSYQHAFDDAWYRGRDPEQYLSRIQTPVLGCVAWQDEDLGSRSFHSFDALNPSTTWIIGTNGYHGVCDAANVAPYLVGFLDHFVKGVDNGFQRTPHVTLLHDAHGTAAEGLALASGTAMPSTEAWKTTFPTWPVAVHPVALHLGANGRLQHDSPANREVADAYQSPLPSSGNEDGGIAGENNAAWKLPDAAGGSLVFTTPALTHDAEFLGPASANLWLASTATDTDVQVTVSEVRPDGQELYAERGWLRASHRALDRRRSTSLRPFHTHQEADAKPLTPGAPTLLRIEINPFDYVFRAGSAIRFTIDTPASSGAWVFAVNPTPATNTILHDTTHDSQLVLGLVPNGRAELPALPCDTVLNQPCRPNLAPVPGGHLDIRRR